ncbi:MAG: hypothetical protein AAFW81_03995 [Pseudomonadota bacterium]
MRLFRLAVGVFALLMIIAGAATAVTPIPFGLPLVILGFLLLATASPAMLKWLRTRWRWLNRRLLWLEKKLPRWMTGPLRRTDPHIEEDEARGDDEEQDDYGQDDDERRGEDAASPPDRAAIARRLLKRASD